MKALFIGGTGNISLDITRLLAEQYADTWEVTLLNRGNHTEEIPDGVRLLKGDISDEAAVARLIEGMYFDVVANFINFTPDQIQRDLRLFAGKTGQYIFISSASAYQKPPVDPVITESTPLSNPYWQYSRDKIACEDCLTEEMRRSGFPFTIVRPSHTYSDKKIPVAIHGQRGSWQTVQRILDGKPVLVPGDGNSLWTLTHTTDFAKAFVGLMGNPHAIGHAVHITSDESLTWNEIYAALGRALGREVKTFHLSTDLITACDPSFEGALCGDKSNTVLFDNRKIKHLVPGFTATMRYDQGVRRAVAYHLAHPEAQTPDPEFDAWCDAMYEAFCRFPGLVKETLAKKT